MTYSLRTPRFALAALAALALVGNVAACGGSQKTIRGSKIADNEINRNLLEYVDRYRRAVEERDIQALILMASPKYWEDSGTPTANDDYGYEGLQQVLGGTFSQASDTRYAIRTVAIRRQCPTSEFGEGCRAYVDIVLDASFSITDARNQPVRADKRDQNQLVFEWDGAKWLITSGM